MRPAMPNQTSCGHTRKGQCKWHMRGEDSRIKRLVTRQYTLEQEYKLHRSLVQPQNGLKRRRTGGRKKVDGWMVTTQFSKLLELSIFACQNYLITHLVNSVTYLSEHLLYKVSVYSQSETRGVSHVAAALLLFPPSIPASSPSCSFTLILFSHLLIRIHPLVLGL